MTTLYRPVPIESAEQAEALPIGTVVLRDETAPWLKQDGPWQKRADGAFLGDQLAIIGATGVIGGTALVPIEAEEETHSIQTRGQTTPEWRTRLVTPWEPADRITP